jgi:hypothetical protein
MANCGERVGNTQVEFHVVGSSETIDNLQLMSIQLGLKNVFFHGTKTTEELNGMYEFFDIGLGCLALHRRNADIDTTLKVIEYYCRGVPVISSGKCPFDDSKFSYILDDGDGAINIESVLSYFNGLSVEELKTISARARFQFSWDNIMSNCLKGIVSE